MRGEVSVTAVGGVDSCKLHPFLIIPGIRMREKEIQMKPSIWKVSNNNRFKLGIKQCLYSCLPDICISLSVQWSQTYLFPTHPLPLLFSGGIWGIHGAGQSCETNISLTISFYRCVSLWGHIPKSLTISKNTTMTHKRLGALAVLISLPQLCIILFNAILTIILYTLLFSGPFIPS